MRTRRAVCGVALTTLLFLTRNAGAQTLRVPAFTAYAEPNPTAVTFSEARGVTGWRDGTTRVVWHGRLTNAGTAAAAVVLRLPAGERVTLRLHAGTESRTATVQGAGATPVTAAFGDPLPLLSGYNYFSLEGVTKSGGTFGEVEALVLSGEAVKDAQFNLTPRRNAASVHLKYPTPDGAKIVAFYNEVTAQTDPLHTFYMACGFRRGYFGMQVNSATERRIIFSVWDSGSEAVDRKNVGAENLVQLTAKGEGVFVSGFGNEGTGGHSHLVYPWNTGETYRFCVTAKPDGDHTLYAGYFYFPERRAWGLIAAFLAPKDGGTLQGLHSFNENFGGETGDKRRLAEYGPAWIRTAGGAWQEVTEALFSHDGHGKVNRTDYGAGAAGSRFFLSNGGYLAAIIHYGDRLRHAPSGSAPPALPIDILK